MTKTKYVEKNQLNNGKKKEAISLLDLNILNAIIKEDVFKNGSLLVSNKNQPLT